MKQDDGELIHRWRAGDPAAFDDLVRRWQQPVARFLVRILGAAAPVSDLSQDVFLRVYLSRDRYREEGTFSAWIYRIALNIARDHSRRQARRPIPLREEVAIVSETGNRSGQQWEIQEAVEMALAQLTPTLREVLVLRHYEDMNFEDMARLLCVPASTLKSRFAVALKKMHALMQLLGWDEEEADS
jgi:RNA polymerase sigma-70 factor (ECF subfamily)